MGKREIEILPTEKFWTIKQVVAAVSLFDLSIHPPIQEEQMAVLIAIESPKRPPRTIRKSGKAFAKSKYAANVHIRSPSLENSDKVRNHFFGASFFNWLAEDDSSASLSLDFSEVSIVGVKQMLVFVVYEILDEGRGDAAEPLLSR